MDNIKKTGIIAGAVVGGLIGGTLSVVGKMSKIKLIDDIGESVVDSTILTGTIVGKVASGATDVVAGSIAKDSNQVQEGASDLKDTGKQVVNNFMGNVKLVAGSSGEIASGVRHRNKKKIKHGIKSLVKIATVGVLTVGAIKVKDDEKADSK